MVTLRLAARTKQPRNLAQDSVQKELVKSQKRKKKTVILSCWIRRIVTARGVVMICVGSVQLKNVLLDLGATCNIVDSATWQNLKQKKSEVQVPKV